MIPIELLKQVKTIVTHADCPDGLASAMILHDALPEAEIVFAQHGKPSLLDLQPSPGMLFCDITPPPGRADEFNEAGAIVLDHHIDKEAVVAKFGERGVFAHETREPGVSGAVLAYREVWEPWRSGLTDFSEQEKVADFAMLAGIRDCWLKDHPRWGHALVAYHALTLHDWDYWKDKPPYLTSADKEVGIALLQKRERDVEQCARNAWIGPVSVMHTRVWHDGVEEVEDNEAIEVARIALAIVNSPYELASDVSDWLRENQRVDLILAFRYEARGEDQVMRISARSGERYDCAVLAKACGGGGHTRAAGFELHDDGDPFFMLMDVVRKAPQPVRP